MESPIGWTWSYLTLINCWNRVGLFIYVLFTTFKGHIFKRVQLTFSLSSNFALFSGVSSSFFAILSFSAWNLSRIARRLVVLKAYNIRKYAFEKINYFSHKELAYVFQVTKGVLQLFFKTTFSEEAAFYADTKEENEKKYPHPEIECKVMKWKVLVEKWGRFEQRQTFRCHRCRPLSQRSFIGISFQQQPDITIGIYWRLPLIKQCISVVRQIFVHLCVYFGASKEVNDKNFQNRSIPYLYIFMLIIYRLADMNEHTWISD